MAVYNYSSITIGWVALAMGIAGLLGLVCIALFFTIGQPFGTLNDIFIGLTAILSVILVWMLYSGLHAQFPIPSLIVLIVACTGTVVVMVGSTLAIFGITGWYLSGLYMAAGNGLIGLWLIVFSFLTLRNTGMPHGLVIFGFISGVILILGLVAIPGIIRGTDIKDYTITTVNAIWWTSALGWLALYPIWGVQLGHFLLSK